MCISIRKIGVGYDVQEVYKQKMAENYTYENLPKNKMFHNFFTLDRDNVRFVIGSDSNNGVSLVAYTESVDTDKINDIYVRYLELFFKNQYSPMPEHARKAMSSDKDMTILNGASDSSGDMVILGTMPDPKDDTKTVWLAFILSPARLGFRTPNRTQYSRTPSGDSSRSIDLWDVIGTAGTVAGLFSLF